MDEAMTLDGAKKRKTRPDAATLPPACDALLGRDQVCASLGCISVRTFDRMLSAAEFPAPDTHLGVRPMWRVATVNGWIDSKCRTGS